MDTGSIPAASIELSLGNTQTAVDNAVLKDSMDMAKQNSEMLIQSMENLSPNLGHLLDVTA